MIIPNLNLTVLYRSALTVIFMATGYSIFAFATLRLTELLIAAGIVIITIPIAIMFHRERKQESPWGPVNRWGMRS